MNQKMKINKAIIGPMVALLAVIVFVTGCNQDLLQKNPVFILHPGDLLFQDLDCGPFCDAIEKVTTGYKRANLSHIGIVADGDHGNVVVIEALLTGVEVTPIDTFLDRSHDTNGRPKVLVGRLIPKHRCLIPFVLREALALKGKPYDKLFGIDNDAYYCSELVYHCFLKANNGKPIFELQPMTFMDPKTGKTFPVWKEYFEQLKAPIPQGNLGINPGDISRSHILTIIHAYGAPSSRELEKRQK
ncbi:MAG: YiiX/YebB-like N1pC/P60 family cysteine hydrolase [Candidatus Omnitrophota bacterium]|nr:YiiX/YebB-like N1pC/P60 family cysteine hydrolase [Candidatus Omnitrophota bacterium]